MTEPTVVIGSFEHPEQARKAVGELLEAGFTEEEIGLMLRDENVAVENDLIPEQGAASGAIAGGALGGILGAAATALLVPGVGMVAAGGILAGALAGATAGITGGGFLGAMIGMGISEEEAKHYETEIQGGRSLVVVQTPDRQGEAARIIGQCGAYSRETNQGSNV